MTENTKLELDELKTKIEALKKDLQGGNHGHDARL